MHLEGAFDCFLDVQARFRGSTMSIENNKPSHVKCRSASKGSSRWPPGFWWSWKPPKALAACTPSVSQSIDRRNFHLFQPLLYQVADPLCLPPSEIAWPIRSVFAGPVQCRSGDGSKLIGSTSKVDSWPEVRSRSRLITWLSQRWATHAYFGHDTWASFAPGLKTVADAQKIRERLLACL